MRIKVHVQTNKIGSKVEDEFEIEDDASMEEIEETARDMMFQMIEWGWEREDAPASR